MAFCRFRHPLLVGGLVLTALFLPFGAPAPIEDGIGVLGAESSSSSSSLAAISGGNPSTVERKAVEESPLVIGETSVIASEEERMNQEAAAVGSTHMAEELPASVVVKEVVGEAKAFPRESVGAAAADVVKDDSIIEPVTTQEAVGGSCSSKIKVMNYNTRQLPKFLLFNDWDQDARLKRLPDTLRRPEYQADVLILEELMTEDAYKKVQELSDVYPYITTVVGKDCSGKDLTSITGPCSRILPRSGVMALSKLPILETHGLIYKYAAAGTWDAKCNKGAIYLKLLVNGLHVHVVGTHTQADEGKVDGGPTRILQMKHLLEWMRTFPIPDDEPIILAGDINTELGSEEQHQIFDGNFNFHFVKHDFGTFSASTNWLTRADAYVSKTSIYAEKHLDYIATWTHHLQPIRPAFMSIIQLKAKESWYWNYLEGWWILHEGPYHHDGYYNDVSDHYPVVADFEFRSPTCPAPTETNLLQSQTVA